MPELSDADLLKLDELLAEEELYQMHQGLKEYNSKTNPNYKFLHQALTNQKYETDIFSGDEELVAGKRGCVLEGSSRCFAGTQKVITDSGSKPISEMVEGDRVLTFNEKTSEKEFKLVRKTLNFKSNKKKCYRLKLKNGSIIEVTQDHEFYVRGEWIPIKNIVDGWNKEKL